jgi:hypothetical protein
MEINLAIASIAELEAILTAQCYILVQLNMSGAMCSSFGVRERYYRCFKTITLHLQVCVRGFSTFTSLWGYHHCITFHCQPDLAPLLNTAKTMSLASHSSIWPTLSSHQYPHIGYHDILCHLWPLNCFDPWKRQWKILMPLLCTVPTINSWCFTL